MMKFLLLGLGGYLAYKYTDGFKFFLNPSGKLPEELPPTTPDLMVDASDVTHLVDPYVQHDAPYFPTPPRLPPSFKAIITPKTAAHLKGLYGNAGFGPIGPSSLT